MRHGASRFASVLLLTLLSIGCEGPTGPEGPAGPQGEPGPGTRMTFQGQVDGAGDAVIVLPEEAGTISDPPSVSCYISDASSGPYLLIATESQTGVACGISRNSTGALYVVIVGVPADWYYRVVVVF